MEEILKRCWKRRDYERLEQSSSRGKRRTMNVGRLGRTRGKKRTFRIKFKPRVSCLRRLISPKNLFIRLRDKYVKMMLRLAQSSSALRGEDNYYKMVVGGGAAGASTFEKRPFKEYDNAMILDIYKSFMTQDKLINGSYVDCCDH